MKNVYTLILKLFSYNLFNIDYIRNLIFIHVSLAYHSSSIGFVCIHTIVQCQMH